jgi:hypothetical protein
MMQFYLIKINYQYFWLRYKPKTVEKYMEKFKRESHLSFLWFGVLARIWGYIYNTPLGEEVISLVFFDSEYEKILSLKKIDQVFIPTTDVIEDIILSNTAKKNGIPVSCMVHSWDNLPSRGSLLAHTDNILVWNAIMAQQAKSFHHIDESKIIVVGISQYDCYKFKMPLVSRKDFLKKREIPVDSHIITYTCSAQRVFPDEPLFLEKLINLVQSKTFGDAVLIIRLHPTERYNEYIRLFQNKANIRIDIPDGLFAASLKEIQASEGIENFVNLLYHSDVIINLASTTTIDAAVFDTPIVNIAYNVQLSDTEWNAAYKWYQSTHFENIVKTKGTKIVHSEPQLIDAINIYLNNKNINHNERTSIVQEQCYKIDGLVAKRICDAIKELEPK